MEVTMDVYGVSEIVKVMMTARNTMMHPKDILIIRIIKMQYAAILPPIVGLVISVPY
jgi:hypothetical protein